MNRFEVLVWIVLISGTVGLLVGGIVSIIVMVVEVYAENVRRLKARGRRVWARCFWWREGAATPDNAPDPQRG